jgi:3-isopropylmalate/(R)-2-methylmalate dehydratase large subunit
LASALTLYEKLWQSHVVADLGEGEALLYIDRQILHEVSSPQAFVAMREAGRQLRRPETHYAVADHAVPTRSPHADQHRHGAVADAQASAQIAELEANVQAFGVPYADLDGPEQGIVHVIGPESGFTLPGTTIVCGDSHTTTHGAFGALAFGIGASEQGTVMAAQCLRQSRMKTMRIDLVGQRHPLIAAKDIALAIIAAIGAHGAAGHAVEFTGPVVRAMSMAERMTLCNMMIEAGSRIGLVAPDATTYAYLQGRRLAPQGALWDQAVAYWESLASDQGALYDKSLSFDVGALAPQVSWGTTPDQTLPIDTPCPIPARSAIPPPAASWKRRWPIWISRRARPWRACPSPGSSSAPAPMAASRICAPPPPWPMGGRWPRGFRRWWCRAPPPPAPRPRPRGWTASS